MAENHPKSMLRAQISFPESISPTCYKNCIFIFSALFAPFRAPGPIPNRPEWPKVHIHRLWGHISNMGPDEVFWISATNPELAPYSQLAADAQHAHYAQLAHYAHYAHYAQLAHYAHYAQPAQYAQHASIDGSIN